MTTPQQFDWNDDAVADLKRLWGDGFSAGEVARALFSAYGGPITRSAVIGKVHRLGLPSRGNYGHNLPAPKKTRIEIKDRIVELSPRKKKMATDVAPHPDPARLENGALITLEDLRSAHCRWPHGDPLEAGFHFCGLPQVENSPYCAFHKLRNVRAVVNKREKRPVDNSDKGRNDFGHFTRIWG